MRGRSEWIRRCRSIKCSCQLPVSGGSAEALPFYFWGFMKIVRLAALGGTAEAAVPTQASSAGALCVLPLFVGCGKLLAGTTGLHAVAGFAEVQSDLLAFEAEAGQGIWSTVILTGHSRVGGCRRLQFNYMRGHFCDHVLASQNVQFDVGTAAFPLNFVVPWLQGGSIDGDRIGKLQTGFCCGKRARRQNQR